MPWKPVRNKDYYTKGTYNSGECPRFNETATLYIHLSGKQIYKTDLQPTFSCRPAECSLLKEKNEKDTTCMYRCPILKEYKDSYSY